MAWGPLSGSSSQVITSAVAIPFLRTGLLAYYKFESDGTDSHDNGYDLTLVNVPTFVIGEVGNAIDFEASSDQRANNTAFNDLNGADKFTLMCWFKGETVTGTHTIIGQFTSTNTTQSNWLIQIQGSQLKTYTTSSTTWDNAIITTNTPFSVDTIYHLRVTYDLTQSTELDRVKYWVDGTLIANSDKTVESGTQPSVLLSNDIDLQFGAWGAGYSDFDGWIDEAGLWDYVLTDSEADLHRLKTGLPY